MGKGGRETSEVLCDVDENGTIEIQGLCSVVSGQMKVSGA